MKTHKQVLESALEEPKIKEEYDKLAPKYEKIRKKIQTRLSKKE